MNQSDDDHDVCTFDEDFDLYIKQGCAIIIPPGFAYHSTSDKTPNIDS